MSFVWRLNKKQRNDLVSGYLRNSNIIFIPHDLHKICLSFYDVIIDWKIADKNMEKFTECIRLDGPSFVVDEIPFQLKVFPNGRDYDGADSGYVQLAIYCCEKATLPSHIYSYRIYLELFCFETKYQFRKMMSCDNKRYHICQWYRFSTLLDSLKHKNLKELNFGCFVEILSIEYDEKHTIHRYIRPLSMNTYCYCYWKLNKMELELFKSSRVDSSLYSPTFNNGCWCIVFVPYGWSWNKKTQNHLFAKVKLLKLPFGIKTIEIESVFVIQSDKRTVGWTCSKKCHIEKPGIVNMHQRIAVKQFEKCGVLSIVVTMKILNIYDDNDQQIDQNNWQNYGVCA